MARLEWDQDTERLYETGVKYGVLYVKDSSGEYGTGVAWNGLTAVTESPSGGEANPLYADNMKYLNLRSVEEFGGTIECYTYPNEWMECDGSAAISSTPGVYAGQQVRKSFGFCYRTEVGNDTEFEDYGYKLHLVYNASASPSEKNYQTINDNPEAITFSYEFETTPVPFTGTNANKFHPTAVITIDTSKMNGNSAALAKVTQLEEMLYGKDATTGQNPTAASDPTLPSPDEVINLFGAISAGA